MDEVGGLIGDAANTTVSNSYAIGVVTGEDYVGGLIGEIEDSTITGSHAEGEVTGDDSLGGLFGTAYRSTVLNSMQSAMSTVRILLAAIGYMDG